MKFAEKLHHLLGQKEIQDSIAWVPDGRAFRVMDSKLLQERNILHGYFGCADFCQFVEKLQQHGFKMADHENNKNTYYHEARFWCFWGIPNWTYGLLSHLTLHFS
jgi:HSF-type DNA-binding